MPVQQKCWRGANRRNSSNWDHVEEKSCFVRLLRKIGKLGGSLQFSNVSCLSADTLLIVSFSLAEHYKLNTDLKRRIFAKKQSDF